MKAQTGEVRDPYSAKNIAFIQAHFNIDMTGKEVADHIGVREGALRQQITRFRKRGYEIAQRAAAPQDVRTRSDGRGGLVTTQKQPNGKWKAISRQTAKTGPSRPKVVRTAPTKRATVKTQPRAKEVARRKSSRAMPDKNKVVNNANPDNVKVPVQKEGKWVRRDSKTVVFVKHAP